MAVLRRATHDQRYGAGRRRCHARRSIPAVCGAAFLWLAALGGPVSAEPEPVRIVALGDSLVHGYGLPPEEGFVPQLAGWLDARGIEAEVQNAGVSGDTSAGGLARFEWSVLGAPGGADALVIVLGGNDLLRGIDPAATRANLDALLGKASAAGLPVLLSGMRAPGNYGAAYKAAFDAIYPELAAKHDALLDPYFLEGVDDDPALWQPDGLHPNGAGVARIVERMGPRVLELVRRAAP